MKQLRIAPRWIWVWLAVAVSVFSAVAGAVNVNGNGASLSLPTTDLSSGGVQSNAAGGRLISAGTPDVGVVSTNGASAKVIIEPMNAIAGNGAPVANFSAGPLTGRAPLEVQFTDLSTSAGLYSITTWTWDFGDGAPASSEQNPKHTYDSPGTYDVTLTITTSGGGSVWEVKTAYISAVQGVPVSRWPGLAALAVALGVAGVFAPRSSSAWFFRRGQE